MKLLHILMISTLLTVAGKAGAQQVSGEWKLQQVNLETHDFWSNALISKQVLTVEDAMKINAPLYNKLAFRDTLCVMERGNNMETWSYRLKPEELELRDLRPSGPDAPVNKRYFPYASRAAGSFEIGPMSASYTDKTTGQPVRIVYTCLYIRTAAGK